MKSYTLEEIKRHNRDGDSWVVIDGKVYDLSKFAEFHPGGKQVLLANSGQDVTLLYKMYHHDSVMKKYDTKLCIGNLKDFVKPPVVVPPGAFGDMVPYGDPIWYQRFNSPYYKDTHKRWRAHVRNFVETEILPTVETWVGDNKPPQELYKKMGRAGLLAAMCGPPWPAQYLPPDVPAPEDFDYFHELIVFDEISRCGYSGVIAALTNGPAIGLPVILRFAHEDLKQRVVPDVLLGNRFISLAVSEPQTGSDVAGIVTTAKREGDYFVVNGNKKWITNGMYAYYHVAVVRTGRPGELSFLLIEDDLDGFSKRKIEIRNSDISGTAYLDFDNCRVPASNLIGEENKGFKLVMYNFNHERLYIVAVMCRLSRVCLEESIKYAIKRKAFGKQLSDIQNIRMKVAAMIRAVESQQAWLDSITYQMCTMTHKEANEKIGDVISLLKAQGSKVYEYCARETTMIFGGNSMFVGGIGRKIEPAVVQVKGYQIPAGAEDVMDDYAGRMAFKRALAMAKL